MDFLKVLGEASKIWMYISTLGGAIYLIYRNTSKKTKSFVVKATKADELEKKLQVLSDDVDSLKSSFEAVTIAVQALLRNEVTNFYYQRAQKKSMMPYELENLNKLTTAYDVISKTKTGQFVTDHYVEDLSQRMGTWRIMHTPEEVQN